MPTRLNGRVKKGTSRTRIGRHSERNRIYHVTTCTYDRAPIFASLQIGRLVVRAIRCAERLGYARTLSFVVMPDHLHWLLQLDGDKSLSDTVCLVKSRSSRHIHSVVTENRRIWQRGFHDRALRAEEDVAAVARYIAANPRRAGLVASVRDYALWDAIWL